MSAASGGIIGAAEVAEALSDCLGLSHGASARPHATLSSGEAHLADVAWLIAAGCRPAGGCTPGGGAASSADAGAVMVCVDEFTSALDRQSAARVRPPLARGPVHRHTSPHHHPLITSASPPTLT